MSKRKEAMPFSSMEKIRTPRFIFFYLFPAALIPGLFFAFANPAKAQDFPKQTSSNEVVLLKYNNENLVSDLGVGLWGWPLPIDYDSDGDYDLVVSCPDKPYNGLYFFENPSGGKEKFPVFNPPVYIGPGKSNIQLSYVDGNAVVTGRGVEYKNFARSAFSEPVACFPNDSVEKGFSKIRFSLWKYADFENDGDNDLIVGIDDWADYGWDNAFDSHGNWTNGPLHGFVVWLENEGGNYKIRGKVEAAGKPIDVYGCPSPNLGDFDGDGDLDIICGEFLDRFTWFENTGTRENPVYSAGRFLENQDGVIKMDLEMIVPVAVDWDKDGDLDIISGDEDGRVALIENTGKVSANMPVFNSPVYFKQKSEDLKFGALVTPFSTDWDNDGDEDLICGNSAGYISFIENLGGGVTPKWALPQLLKADGKIIRILAGENGSIQGPAEKKWGYTVLNVADWDGDGLKDIVINSIWGKIEWFRNIGTKQSPVLSKSQPVEVEWGKESPKPAWNWWNPEGKELVTQWRTTPCLVDWNRDGLIDLVMLDHEGYLSFFERFREGEELKLKPGERIFYSTGPSVYNSRHGVLSESAGLLRLNGETAGKSGRRKFCFVDWDHDGDLDLLVNSTNVALLENIGTKDGLARFRDAGNLFETALAGHTTCPTVVDWDKDGLPELLVGAEDGHFYYLPHR